MYVNSDAELTGGSFLDRFAEIPAVIGARVPTFDKSLDAYFDKRFSAIIEEWDLVTETDLAHLSQRLERVSDEITGRVAERAALEARAEKLDDIVASLERSS